MNKKVVLSLVLLSSLAACSKYPSDIQITDNSGIKLYQPSYTYTLYAVNEDQLNNISSIGEKTGQELEQARESLVKFNDVVAKIDTKNISTFDEFKTYTLNVIDSQISDIQVQAELARKELEPLLPVKVKADEAKAQLEALQKPYKEKSELYTSQYDKAKNEYDELTKSFDALQYNVRSIGTDMGSYTLDKPVDDCGKHLITRVNSWTAKKFPAYLWGAPITDEGKTFCTYYKPGNLEFDNAVKFINALTPEQKQGILTFIKAHTYKKQVAPHLDKLARDIWYDNDDLRKQSELLSSTEEYKFETFERNQQQIPTLIEELNKRRTDETLSKEYIDFYFNDVAKQYAMKLNNEFLSTLTSYPMVNEENRYTAKAFNTEGEQSFILVRQDKKNPKHTLFNVFTITENLKDAQTVSYALDTPKLKTIFAAQASYAKKKNTDLKLLSAADESGNPIL
ncbi:hypothetical protein L2712_18925 [Shewanella marisflavi]|uniref:hypothetical protein n=1 Tax=Shewanella marisflavi TaxID=260364 RepID=UPI00200E80E6|nr:hypothetical protein [Shewanella marisflavi]MCL1043704.1 hypothetical protein [Shewanella marisflavi]